MSEWRTICVGDLGRIVTGKTPKTAFADNYGGEIPFLTPSDDMSVKAVETTAKSLTVKGLSEVKNCLLPPRSICVSCIGSDLGKVVMITQPTVTNQQINSIIPADDVDSDFVYYAMAILGKELNYISKTSTAVPIVNKSSFSSCTVRLPSLDEQRVIAATLSALDDKIALNTKVNRNLKQMAQAIFKSWFVDFEPWGGVMPDGWRFVKLGTLCESVSKTHSYSKDELVFLNTGDIESGLFLHASYSPVRLMPGQAKKSIQRNDILYSEIRPINRHFAFVNFEAPDYIVSTKLMVIRANCIDSRRLYHYLSSEDVIIELQAEAESRSGTFPQIRFDNIQRKEILVATPEIEKEFSTILHDIYDMIDSNNAESARLAAIRDALLPRLMSGELPASELADTEK